MIANETEMVGAVAKSIRKSLALPQHKFWANVGIKQAGGCRYERGQQIPQPVRILLFARYVVGLQMDATTPEGVAAMKRLARISPE